MAHRTDRPVAAVDAFNLAQTGRVADARAYARAALRTLETYGAGATGEIQRTQPLRARLDV